QRSSSRMGTRQWALETTTRRNWRLLTSNGHPKRRQNSWFQGLLHSYKLDVAGSSPVPPTPGPPLPSRVAGVRALMSQLACMMVRWVKGRSRLVCVCGCVAFACSNSEPTLTSGGISTVIGGAPFCAVGIASEAADNDGDGI